MPTYEYRRSSDAGCPYCIDGFDHLQRISAPSLTQCPQCGAPVHRIISAPALATSGVSLSPGNLEKHGFTQYRKSGDGVYEKTAGSGPDTLKK